MGLNFSDALNLAKSGEVMARKIHRHLITLYVEDGMLRVTAEDIKTDAPPRIVDLTKQDVMATDWDLLRSLVPNREAEEPIEV